MEFRRGAWFQNAEKKSKELIEKIDFDTCKIDCRKLKVKKIVDKGSYGIVYEGKYGDIQVAVKVFHMTDEASRFELIRSFAQEVSLAKDLDHPNIAKFFGATKNMGEVDIKSKKKFDRSLDCCIVTEFLPGGTLYQYLRRHHRKKLPISIVIQLALDVAEGLSYLHSKNIMHRDVKTSNMLLDKNSRVKIIDFGISRFEDLNEMTQNTGTQGYIAPEVLVGRSYDHKCDVFSFGICLWEIFCCTPYQSSGKLKMSPDIPMSCPSALADLMRRCWDADSERRPEMRSVVETLREIESSSSLNHSNERRRWLFCFST